MSGPQRTRLVSGAARNAVEQHEQMLKSMEMQKQAQQIKCPTADSAVMGRLRALKQPIILFGEDAPTRRDRLRDLLALMLSEGKEIPEFRDSGAAGEINIEEVNKKRPFYKPGSALLQETRIRMLHHSMMASKIRVRAQKRRREEEHARGEAAVGANRKRHKAMLTRLKAYDVDSSTVGGARTLSACRFSSDGKHIATGSWTGRTTIWTADGEEVRKLAGHYNRITGLAFKPEPAGRPWELLATASADKTVNLWRADGSKAGALTGHRGRLARVEFHPLNNYLGTACYDRSWRLWDVKKETCVIEQTGHSREVYCIAFHKDGSLVGTGDLGGVGRLWDLRTGKAIMAMEGHVKQILACDFHPNGYYFATGADDNMVKIWDLRRKDVAYTIPAHQKSITRCKFEPGGEWLATASFDNTCKLWSCRTFNLAHTLSAHDDKIMDADVSADGKRLVTCSYDRTWKIWEEQDLGVT